MANFKSTKKGRYKVKNVSKFIPSLATRGVLDVAIYRSGWEKYAFMMCDLDPAILKWGSECVKVPYQYRLDPKGKYRNYYPDLYIEWMMPSKNNEEGQEVVKFLVEIKPGKECKPPRKGKNQAYYARDLATWFMNSDKWMFAEQMCQANNTRFVKWSEQDIAKIRQRVLTFKGQSKKKGT